MAYFRKSVDLSKKCAGELPTVPASDQDPTRILHDDLWSRKLRVVEFVRTDVITGMVLEAGSRMKIEASRGPARVNARVRKWALEAVMGSKKAARAYLKGSGSIRREGEGEGEGEGEKRRAGEQQRRRERRREGEKERKKDK